MAIAGNVLSLIQLSTGRLLAGTGGVSGTIYRSDDNGLNWTPTGVLGTGGAKVNAMTKDTAGNVFAVVSDSSNTALNGIYKGTVNGTIWQMVHAHPNNLGYYDITAIQSFRLVAVGPGVTDTNTSAPIVVSNDAGATWVYAKQPHYGHPFNSVASSPDPVLPTAYPGDTVTVNPAFYGSNTYYTAVGRAGLTGYGPGNVPQAAAFNMPVDPMGHYGLDMVSFLIKDNGGAFRSKALWAVPTLNSPTHTEVWAWPATPTGPYKFVKVATISNEIFNVMYVDPLAWQSIGLQRTIWAGANGKIFVSYNSGLTWALATDAPVGQIYSLVRTTSGVLIAGGASGEIYRFTGTGSSGGGGTTPTTPPVDPPPPPVIPTDDTPPTSAFLGRTETTENEVFVSNKMSFSNVTHIFHYNNSTYDELQFFTTPPYQFLGSTLAVGKAVYFGSQTNNTEVPGGTFANLVFNITQPLQNATIAWEYWNGTVWTALTVFDSSDGFKLEGSRSVHWHPPATWTTTTVNSIVGYWVRARVSAVAASPQIPIQDERYIYTVLLPYVEVSESAIGGDLPAVARIQWHNRADNIASTMAMEADRIVSGLRTLDRGENFQAYLNISDVQAPFGITVTAGIASAWSTVKTAPTARALTVSYVSAPQLNVWNDLATFTLSTTVATDYYGSYRAFVRGYKSSGSANVWQVRIQTTFGSGGSTVDSKVVFPTSVADWEVFDLGQISIPTTQIAQQSGNLGDELTISVQGKCSALSSSLTLYDLILIPVDEWAIDARPPRVASSMASQVKSTNFLDIDSITNPKANLLVLNRNEANQIVSRYQALNNGPAILQSGRQQRLWFLVMATTGTYWYAYPALVGSVQVFRQQRYLGLRGIN